MLLLRNARISGRPDAPPQEAIAIAGGRIVDVGSDERLRALRGSGVEEIDAGGRRIVPGLIDGHAHVVRGGLTWDRELRWDESRSLDEALDLLAARAMADGPDAWVTVVGGWSAGQFREGRGPTRDDLDRVAPDNPCYVQLLYDEAVLNTRGLERCGFARGSADPPGGVIDRDETGSPTGVVRGAGAFRHCLETVGKPGDEQQVRSTRTMLRDLAAYGLTGALDPGGIGLGPESYRALFELWRRDELALRLRLYLGAGHRGDERREITDWMRFLPRGFGDDRLRITGIGEIVVFRCWDGDGLTPFEVDAEAFQEFTELSELAASGGWPMHVHAIVDESASAILDAWEAVGERRPIAPLRFSLAHADAVSDRTLQRARRLGIGIALQDRMVLRAAGSVAAWGTEAVEQAPPLRRMVELGFPLSAGTDATVVSSINPWLSLWWLVTGRTLGGLQRRAEHRLSRADALRLYTAGSTWFSFEEGTRGQLAPGFLADLAVLSDDYYGVPDDEIPSIRSDLTLLGGAVVHAAAAMVDVNVGAAGIGHSV